MKILPLLPLGLMAACQPAPPPDLIPPRLLEAAVDTAGQDLSLTFDEPLADAEATLETPGPRAPAVVAGDQVKVPLPPALSPGRDYRWTAEVKDSARNVTSVSGTFYGPNTRPARLRLNEVRIAGSGNRTDLVELRAESPGSLGGWTLEYRGRPEDRVRFVFPDVEVAEGALIVLHCRPGGSAEEVDERQRPDESGGPEADPGAWDYWLKDGKGLSAVKGVLSLRPSPTSPPSDALLYSRKPGDAAPLARAAGWPGRAELDPSGCTATRTWCRDDETPAGWMLVANGQASPGRPNRLTPWKAPSSPASAPRSTKEGREADAPAAGSTEPRRPGSRPVAAVPAGRPSRRGSGGASPAGGRPAGRPARRGPTPQARVVRTRHASPTAAAALGRRLCRPGSGAGGRERQPKAAGRAEGRPDAESSAGGRRRQAATSKNDARPHALPMLRYRL